MTHEQIALAGGLYVPLVFMHFLADWLTQTEKMAEEKSKKPNVLILHCFMYTAMFWPIFYLYDLALWERCITVIVLFVSHLVGDTYLPVFWWAKYIRRMTTMRAPQKDGSFLGIRVQHPEDIFPNGDLITTPLLFRPSLVLVIDQLWHLAFLWVVPALILWRT